MRTTARQPKVAMSETLGRWCVWRWWGLIAGSAEDEPMLVGEELWMSTSCEKRKGQTEEGALQKDLIAAALVAMTWMMLSEMPLVS